MTFDPNALIDLSSSGRETRYDIIDLSSSGSLEAVENSRPTLSTCTNTQGLLPLLSMVPAPSPFIPSHYPISYPTPLPITSLS